MPDIPGLDFEAAWERRVEIVVDTATGLKGNLISAKPCIANDPRRRIRIDRIVPWNCNDSHVIRHYDVLALPCYAILPTSKPGVPLRAVRAHPQPTARQQGTPE